MTMVRHAVDLAAATSQAVSTVFSLLNLRHQHLFGFRSHIMTVSSIKNMSEMQDLEDGIDLDRLSRGRCDF